MRRMERISRQEETAPALQIASPQTQSPSFDDSAPHLAQRRGDATPVHGSTRLIRFILIDPDETLRS
jgi:hypothetical protein